MTRVLLGVAALYAVLLAVAWAFCLAAAAGDRTTCPVCDWDTAMVTELADVKL